MKRYWIEYTPQWRPGPMSFWVHIHTNGRNWYQATTFEPPLPAAVPGKGYPHYYVEVDRFTFDFASLAELDACVAVLSQKHLPSTEKETQVRGTGPNGHWLNRLPAEVRPWRYREKAVKYLQEARKHLARETEAG